MLWITLVSVVAIALFFDFTNGFHDTANSIATAVSTRALSPRFAVIWAAALNFAGAFLSIKVATTIAKGIVNPAVIQTPHPETGLKVILAALVGAIVWNLTTWFLGLPSSSSHALIGGLLGAAVAEFGFHHNGTRVVISHGLYEKVLAPSLLAPLLAIPSALILMTLILWLIRRTRPDRTNHFFRRLQPLSCGWLAFTHGTNDAQKTMGVVFIALIISGHLPADASSIPIWVKISAASAMALGTYAGGWRIIRTVGQRIAKLEPPGGFAAEATAGTVLWLTAHFGFPVSTTHTVSSSVLGAGAAGSRLSAVRWGVAGNIVIAWLITIPCAALVGAGVELLTRLPGGVFFALGVAAIAAALALLARARHLAAGKREEQEIATVATSPGAGAGIS